MKELCSKLHALTGLVLETLSAGGLGGESCDTEIANSTQGKVPAGLQGTCIVLEEMVAAAHLNASRPPQTASMPAAAHPDCKASRELMHSLHWSVAQQMHKQSYCAEA